MAETVETAKSVKDGVFANIAKHAAQKIRDRDPNSAGDQQEDWSIILEAIRLSHTLGFYGR